MSPVLVKRWDVSEWDLSGMRAAEELLAQAGCVASWCVGEGDRLHCWGWSCTENKVVLMASRKRGEAAGLPFPCTSGSDQPQVAAWPSAM